MKTAAIAALSVAAHAWLRLWDPSPVERQHCAATCQITPEASSGVSRAVLWLVCILLVESSLLVLCCCGIGSRDVGGGEAVAYPRPQRHARIGWIP